MLQSAGLQILDNLTKCHEVFSFTKKDINTYNLNIFQEYLGPNICKQSPLPFSYSAIFSKVMQHAAFQMVTAKAGTQVLADELQNH